MIPERVSATYLIETPLPIEQAAATLAGEQSSGTFVAVPGETAELKERFAARVEAITPLETVAAPSLPTGRPSAARYHRAEVRVSWSVENFGPNLPTLVSTLQGNLYELAQFSGLKLIDFDVPPGLATAFRGPAFGIAGTRRLTGVHGRPIIGTIIKPSIGLSPEQTADMVRVLVAAGIDFIKDDELQADGPHCPFDQRVRAVMREVKAAAQRHGRQAMVAFNLTGEVDQMRRRHDLVLAEGGTCVMVSLNSVGLTGLLALRRHAQLPIHAHRNGWGYLSRSPALGWDYAPWQALWRLAGADHLHVNGLANKFSEPDDSVLAAARAVLQPLDAQHPMVAMPVFSSGQTGLQAAPTHAALGTTDLIHAAGGGILGHPGGIAAGVAAMRQAWDAAVAGVPIADHARQHPALAQALATW